jgi:outer membrane protein assembly factor BamB
LSIAAGHVFVTASSGQLFVLSANDGRVVFVDQTPDLNEVLGLGLGKPHHASMNGGTIIANGKIYVPFGSQNNPSGGILAYEINHGPLAANDELDIQAGEVVVIDALANDRDPDGDKLHFTQVAGRRVDTGDSTPDVIVRPYGTIVVVNPGDDPADPDAAFLLLATADNFAGQRKIRYTVEDLAPNRIVNGEELHEPNPTHIPRESSATIKVF